MLHSAFMDDDTHEDFSFLHIAAATANVISYLRDKKQIDGGTKDERSAEDERSKQDGGKLPIVSR